MLGDSGDAIFVSDALLDANGVESGVFVGLLGGRLRFDEIVQVVDLTATTVNYDVFVTTVDNGRIRTEYNAHLIIVVLCCQCAAHVDIERLIV